MMAAGAAAHIAYTERVTSRTTNVKALQAVLKKSGQILAFKKVMIYVTKLFKHGFIECSGSE